VEVGIQRHSRGIHKLTRGSYRLVSFRRRVVKIIIGTDGQ